MVEFQLPQVVQELVNARNKLRKHFSDSGLNFTLDGKLVGDLGEAISAELFGTQLSKRSVVGIDGFAPDGRTVQVKTTGTGRGPVFRNVETRATHLLFFDLNFEELKGSVIFNGPERIALAKMPTPWVGQRSLTRRQIEKADSLVPRDQRLVIV